MHALSRCPNKLQRIIDMDHKCSYKTEQQVRDSYICYYLRSIRDTSFHIQCLAASHVRTRVATAWWEGVVKGLGGAYGHIKAFEFSLIPTSKESLLLLKACWDDKLGRTRILLHTDIVACTSLHYYVWPHHLHVSKRAQRSSRGQNL